MHLTRTHRVVAVLACIVAPLATSLFDRGATGYTMFGGLAQYRLVVVASRGGRAVPVSCDELSSVVGGTAPAFLIGADRWRAARSTVAIEAHLDAFARAACIVSHGDDVEVTLERRAAAPLHYHGTCR